ncbi:MAG: HU family DNA-binding protein [Synergistes sp.]|nr:HU family DNA-binding protein [Synergistes sp.]
MTKTDLVNNVAKEADGFTKKKTGEIVDLIFGEIYKALGNGERVQIVGFGTFEVQDRSARKGRNPQNPEQIIEIPAKKVPAFRAGKALKEIVNK